VVSSIVGVDLVDARRLGVVYGGREGFFGVHGDLGGVLDGAADPVGLSGSELGGKDCRALWFGSERGVDDGFAAAQRRELVRAGAELAHTATAA
jgi:hypothetical protein